MSATSSRDPPSRPDVDRLCTRLADRIEGNGCRRPTVTAKWRSACQLMLDADGLTAEQVGGAIDWSQADEFWRANILSMPKLRERYDQLRLAAQRASPARRNAAEERMNGHMQLLEKVREIDAHGGRNAIG